MRRVRDFRGALLAGLGGAAAAVVVLAVAAGILVPALCLREENSGVCRPGQADATPPPDDREEWRGAVETAATAVATMAGGAIGADPVAPDLASSSAAQMLAGTFADLSDEAGSPTPRIVRAVPVGPDGRPIPATPPAQSYSSPPSGEPASSAAAEPAAVPVTGPADADDGESAVAGVEAQPAIAPLTEAPAVEAPIPQMRPAGLEEASSADVRTIGGTGVNVRAGPTSSEAVMFALAPGETVTVLDTQRGWLKVVDDQGRTGWAYGDYVQ